MCFFKRVIFGVFALALIHCGRVGTTPTPSDTDVASDADVESDVEFEMDADEEAEEQDADPDVERESVCGNFLCEDDESCVECPTDCGRCPECSLAPNCTGSPAVPTGSERLEDFDNNGQSIYECGAGLGTPALDTECLPAQLRIRLRQLKVYDNGMTPLIHTNVYCIITASNGFQSEIFVTPRHTDIGDDHPPIVFDPTSSLFWGQVDLIPTDSNLTITYQCFKSSDNSDYESIFDTIAEAAEAAGGIAGPYGWAFGLGSIAASIVADAIGSSSGDTLWLNVQQTIDDDALLEMANGRIWQIRQSGEGVTIFEEWDWMLEIESWGCAEPRPNVE